MEALTSVQSMFPKQSHEMEAFTRTLSGVGNTGDHVIAHMDMTTQRAFARGNEGDNMDHEDPPQAPQVSIDPLPESVTNVESRMNFQVLAQAGTAKAKREVVVPVNPNVGTVAPRVRDFTRMNPPEIYGSKVEKDPQEFIDEVENVFTIMGMTVVKKHYSTTRSDRQGCSRFRQRFFEQGSSKAPRFNQERVPNSKPQGNGSRDCTKCGRKNAGECLVGFDGCGKNGHKMRGFPILAAKEREGKQATPSDSELKEVVLKKSIEAFSQGGDGVLRFQGRLCVLNVNELREQILTEAHSSQYSIHPGATKIYRDLREVYWWNGMKKDIVGFVAKCPNYQQLRVEHQKPGTTIREMGRGLHLVTTELRGLGGYWLALHGPSHGPCEGMAKGGYVVKTTARERSRGLMPVPGGVQVTTTARSTDRGPYHGP
ncbi:hypothetical protein MTR67_052301 [Solanum verrucosum]|uniref:Integrase zinc-binding domain-containing protein n=1 Tax=Solanum verrucosum TaxID=315347 RepID=A0AAF0V931_SOLVR|nr:hypothetical protein MTR67_052301 [Solanum verrucosum]